MEEKIKKIDVKLCYKNKSHDGGSPSRSNKSDDEEMMTPLINKKDDNEKMNYIQRKFHEVYFNNIEYTEYKYIQMEYEIE